MHRLNYFRRIFKVYLTKDKGYLDFWHERPAVSENIQKDPLGPYYMTFEDKANYQGPKDENGVILFDYYFDIGRQYNPLAVAQYGLGHYNLYLKTRDAKHLETAKIQADWLLKNLEPNDKDIPVWKHKFPWHYKENLKSGWYSAHSEGAGISLLARMYKETGDGKYLECAKKAFQSLNTDIQNGGVKFTDQESNAWLEEYIIKNPTHILNGFLWALWGVWDFFLLARYAREEKTLSEVEGLQLENSARELCNACIKTLKNNLEKYDSGFWSLYDLSKQRMEMIASHFYHKLHIVQLRATGIISEEPIFETYAQKFEAYEKNSFYKTRALIHKAIFKLLYF